MAGIVTRDCRLILVLLLLASTVVTVVTAQSCPPKTVNVGFACNPFGGLFQFCDEQREGVFARVRQENERLAAANVPLRFNASAWMVPNATSVAATAFAMATQLPSQVPDVIIGPAQAGASGAR